MILPPGVSGFEAILPLKIEGHTYMGYANTETLVCYGCSEFGHVKRSCPKGMPNQTVNEGSTSQQLVERGVRQGCPLSGILQSLCIEPLQICLPVLVYQGFL